MSERTEMYAKAAKAYEDAKKPYDFKEEKDDICGFIVGQEWAFALKMLEAAGKNIEVGLTQGAHSAVRYYLSKDGFSFSYHDDSDSKVTENIISCSSEATDEKVLKIAEAFRNLYPDSERGSFNKIILGELDIIADACPK